MSEKFIDGIGYLYYGTESHEEGGYMEKTRGWWIRRTPDGKPGSSFAPEYLGRNRDEAAITAHEPEIRRALGIKTLRDYED